MAHLRRMLVLLVAALLITAGPLTGSARAAGTEAIKAADYIVSTFDADAEAPYGELSSAADSLLALLATGDQRYDADVTRILDVLKAGAAGYVKPDASGDSGAAKLALVAAATGQSATDFGGVDLIAQVSAGVRPDGTFGAWPGPFSSGIAMVALARNGLPVPDAMVSTLLTYQQPRSGDKGGGFGCDRYPFDKGGNCPDADPDSTALAVLGLRAAGSPQALDAATDALAWLADTQHKNGSWQNYSPVNSAGLAGPLFGADSDQATRAARYVASTQLGSGALTTGNADEPDLIATQQGIFALTGSTYLTIGVQAASPSPAAPGASAQPSAPVTPSGGGTELLWVVVGALVIVTAVIGLIGARTR